MRRLPFALAYSTPSAPMERNTWRMPRSSSTSAALLAERSSVTRIPVSSSASKALGFRVSIRSSTGSSLAALAVETGSAKMGTVQLAQIYAMVSAGRLVSKMHRLALFKTSNLVCR